MSKIIIICVKCKQVVHKHAKNMCLKCYLKHRYKIVGSKPYSDYNRKWRKEHKTQFLKTQKDYLNRNELKLVTFLGGYICVDCGYKENTKAFQIGHINNNGNEDRKKFHTKDQMIAYYLKHLDEAKHQLKMQCANCNAIQQINRVRKR